MRFLFATDIHGNHSKVKYLIKIAPELKAEAIVIGGDIAPKDSPNLNRMLVAQEKWYKWLAERADAKGQKTPIYAFLGNDDMKCQMRDFIEICQVSKKLNYLKVRGELPGGVKYTMYNWVPDYPFGLKDWCKRDKDQFTYPPYWGKPILSNKKSLSLRSKILLSSTSSFISCFSVQ